MEKQNCIKTNVLNTHIPNGKIKENLFIICELVPVINVLIMIQRGKVHNFAVLIKTD